MSASTPSPILQTSGDFSRHLTKNKVTSNSLEAKPKCQPVLQPVESTVITIVEPHRSKSFPGCPNCQKKGILKKSKLFANIFARWHLELKLHHYKIEFTKSRHPLNILKKHFTSAGSLSSNVVWKFNPSELTSLDIVQLKQLKESLEGILHLRNEELKMEVEERVLLSNSQQDLRKQSMELECLARDIMKPYTNIHPLCEELARLMLA